MSGSDKDNLIQEDQEPVILSPENEPIVDAAGQEAIQASCTYDGKTYSHGSQVCQEDSMYLCDDGSWVFQYTPC